MISRTRRDYLVGGFLILLAARAGNWLITPMRHPDASEFDLVAHWVQAVGSLVAGLWLVRRSRTD